MTDDVHPTSKGKEIGSKGMPPHITAWFASIKILASFIRWRIQDMENPATCEQLIMEVGTALGAELREEIQNYEASRPKIISPDEIS